jgi:actin-related protein
MENVQHLIIIELGSSTCKFADSCNDYSVSSVPTLVARRRVGVPNPVQQFTEFRIDGNLNDWYIGNEARVIYKVRPGIWQLQHLIDRGIVADWNLLTKFIMKAYPIEDNLMNDSLVVVVEPMTTSIDFRCRLMEKLFCEEKVRCWFGKKPLLALFGSGRRTGVVVELGYGITEIVPIYEGVAMPHASEQLKLAGCDLTKFMRQMKEEQGECVSEMEVVVAKEKEIRVGFDFEEELKIHPKDEFGLRCGEMLFNPSIGHQHGIHVVLFRSIMKCANEIQREMLNNIVLSGGTSQIPGLMERLKYEIRRLVPNEMKDDVNVVRCPKDQYQGWESCFKDPSFPLATLNEVEYRWLSYGCNSPDTILQHLWF